MKKILVCYADEQMSTSQELCCKSGKTKAGIDIALSYAPHNIDDGFHNFNEDTLKSEQRGGGYGFWLWKPYFIERVIRNLSYGEYIIYADSGIEFLTSLDPIVEQMGSERQDIFLFSNEHRHIDWCKKEVIQHMLRIGPGDVMSIAHKKQVQASVIIARVTPYTKHFFKRWLAWSQIPGFIDDKSAYQQLPEYAEHRNDQSILTNLAIEDNIKLHWWPVQYGTHIRNQYPTDRYPQLFYHHRWRNEQWKQSGLNIESFMKRPKYV